MVGTTGQRRRLRPVSHERLKELAQGGVLFPDTQIRCVQGGEDLGWMPAETLPRLSGLFSGRTAEQEPPQPAEASGDALADRVLEDASQSARLSFENFLSDDPTSQRHCPRCKRRYQFSPGDTSALCPDCEHAAQFGHVAASIPATKAFAETRRTRSAGEWLLIALAVVLGGVACRFYELERQRQERSAARIEA